MNKLNTGIIVGSALFVGMLAISILVGLIAWYEVSYAMIYQHESAHYEIALNWNCTTGFSVYQNPYTDYPKLAFNGGTDIDYCTFIKGGEGFRFYMLSQSMVEAQSQVGAAIAAASGFIAGLIAFFGMALMLLVAGHEGREDSGKKPYLS